jgi:hypothetical protein
MLVALGKALLSPAARQPAGAAKPLVPTQIPACPSSPFGQIAWHWRYDQKIDLWLAWWCMVIFYSLFGVIFVLMAHVIPPPSPAYSKVEILQWFEVHGAGVISGFALTFLITGMAALSNGLIAYSMSRMTVSKAYPTAYIILYSLSALPGMLLCAILFTVAALRPERNFDLILWLYDGAMLTFVGTMGIFLLGTLVWLIAVLIDKNRVLPPWFGYLNICNLLTEIVVAPVWTAKRGAFCWSGSIAFWVDVGIFGLYTAAFIVVLRDMVAREDLATGRMPAGRTVVTQPPGAELVPHL